MASFSGKSGAKRFDRPCPRCAERAIMGDVEFVGKGREVTIVIKGAWCMNCGMGIPSDLEPDMDTESWRFEFG